MNGNIEHAYIVRAIGTQFIKIGKTRLYTDKRINALQTGCPHKLELISDKLQESEEELHQMFNEHRVRGEWFRYEGKLKHFVDSILLKKTNSNVLQQQTHQEMSDIKKEHETKLFFNHWLPEYLTEINEFSNQPKKKFYNPLQHNLYKDAPMEYNSNDTRFSSPNKSEKHKWSIPKL